VGVITGVLLEEWTRAFRRRREASRGGGPSGWTCGAARAAPTKETPNLQERHTGTLRDPNYPGSTTWGRSRRRPAPAPRSAMSHDPKPRRPAARDHACPVGARGVQASPTSTSRCSTERGLAPTTIATMLAKMERKGVVMRRTEGRQFRYSRRPCRRPRCSARWSRELTERLFDGNAAALVSHLLQEQASRPRASSPRSSG
jgi:hypothetical protein